MSISATGDNQYNQYITNKMDYDKLNNLMNGGKKRYSCNKTNEFDDICYEKADGKYKSKDGCVNDCVLTYIDYNLEKVRIKKETNNFKFFIYELFDKEMKVYIKGGSVLGLYVLKMIYDRYHNDVEMFSKAFQEFIKLDLIKDWDFSAIYETTIGESETEDFNTLAHKHKLYPHAKKFILYQTKYPIKIGDDALFEISILQNKEDAMCSLELPMTTMSMQINKRNINYVFMFAKLFYCYKKFNEQVDTNVIMYMISNMKMHIYPYTNKQINGLFRIDKLEKCELSNEFVDFVKDFTKNINLQQFFITQMKEPNRLFYRLIDKNIPKSKKIDLFLKTLDGNKEQGADWLLDQDIEKVVKQFCESLRDKIMDIYHDKKANIVLVENFLDGVNLRRFQEYHKFYNNGKEYIAIVFKDLYLAIKDDIESMDQNYDIVKALKFLSSHEYF